MKHPTPAQLFLGRMSYDEAWTLQKQYFDRMVGCRRDGIDPGPGIILAVEHEPVITMGRHARQENLLGGAEHARKSGVDVFNIERGGDVTFHGPGQVVLYPILNLERYRIGVREYVHMLEECVIRVLSRYGLHGERIEGASGVWLGAGTSRERKICALGIRCSRFITMHGLALNVNTDMSYFRLINPCGFIDKGVTSMAQELGHTLDFNHVTREVSDSLCELLEERRMSSSRR